MTDFRRIALAGTMILQFSASLGCASSVPATVTQRPDAPIKAHAVIFLQANAQREQIAESLRNAGLMPTDQFGNADYTLDARVGRSRGGPSCGKIRNVAYILIGQGKRLAVIKGRGPTGDCKPGIFDQMSQKLASYAAQ